MKKNVLLICISVFIVPISMSHAEPCSDIGQYSCYQERVGEFCTNSSLPWNNEAPSDLGAVGIGKYEAIDATKINNTISNLEQADTNPV